MAAKTKKPKDKKPKTPKPKGNTDTPTTTTPTTGGGVMATDDASILERVRKLISEGETYGQGLADRFYADGSMGRVAETLTPDEQAALNSIKTFAANAGNQSPEVAALIAQQQGILNNAQQYSPYETEALDVNRAALAGLSAPEYQALRSQANEQINGAFQQAARQMAKAQAANQVFGAAATAQNNILGQNRVKEARNLERDLIVKDVEIKRAARNDFTNAVNQTEATKAGRTNAASGQLSNTINSDQSNRNTAQNQANANLSTTSMGLGDRLRQLQEFNLNQAAAEKAGQIGSIFGGIGAIADQRGLLAGEGFANNQFIESQDVQSKIFEIVQKALKSGGTTLGV